MDEAAVYESLARPGPASNLYPRAPPARAASRALRLCRPRRAPATFISNWRSAAALMSLALASHLGPQAGGALTRDQPPPLGRYGPIGVRGDDGRCAGGGIGGRCSPVRSGCGRGVEVDTPPSHAILEAVWSEGMVLEFCNE